jgi:hypothetical protein
MFSFFPVLLFYFPFSLLISSLCLHQFKSLLIASHGVASRVLLVDPMFDVIRPAAKFFYQFGQESLGTKPESLQFSLNHVLLASILFTLLWSIQSAKSQAVDERKWRNTKFSTTNQREKSE